MNEVPVQYETDQYPDESPPMYPAQLEPTYWYPMSIYRPTFWAALLAGIADVAAVVILGSQAIAVAKKTLRHDDEERER